MSVEYVGIRRLADELGMVPIELRRQLRPEIRAGAETLVRDMKSRASYSSRIPSAIRTTVSFSSKSGGVTIRVDTRRAPHARPLERGNHGGRADSFRHPVFGNRDVWVTQPTRPFFFPAVKAGRKQLVEHISRAVKASLRKVST